MFDRTSGHMYSGLDLVCSSICPRPHQSWRTSMIQYRELGETVHGPDSFWSRHESLLREHIDQCYRCLSFPRRSFLSRSAVQASRRGERVGSASQVNLSAVQVTMCFSTRPCLSAPTPPNSLGLDRIVQNRDSAIELLTFSVSHSVFIMEGHAQASHHHVDSCVGIA